MCLSCCMSMQCRNLNSHKATLASTRGPGMVLSLLCMVFGNRGTAEPPRIFFLAKARCCIKKETPFERGSGAAAGRVWRGCEPAMTVAGSMGPFATVMKWGSRRSGSPAWYTGK